MINMETSLKTGIKTINGRFNLICININKLIWTIFFFLHHTYTYSYNTYNTLLKLIFISKLELFM